MSWVAIIISALVVFTSATSSRLADILPPGNDECIYGRVTEIPDGDGEGILIGPISLQDSKPQISGICLALHIRHDFIADLHILLGYDVDCDGELDAVAPIELFQVRPGSHEADPDFVYYFQLDGVYFFRDDKVDETVDLDLQGASDVSACAAGQPIRGFSVFRGLPTGGNFYLSVVDSLRAKTGVLLDWAVGTRG